MKNSITKSQKNFILWKELVKTDFKLRYQGSVLGILWSVLRPLMLFAVMYVVFVEFLRFTDGTPTFPVVLLLGITLWGFFAEATGLGMNAIVGRGDLLRKINFPKYIVILSAATSSLIGLTINICVVLIFAVLSGVQFTWLVLLVPLGILQLMVLALGFSFILSTLYVKFRDVSHIWEVIAQVLFYAIPIIYPMIMVIERSAVAAQVMLLNPIAQTIQDIRHNLIAPETTVTTWNYVESLHLAIIPLVLTVAIFITGIVIFNKNSKKFAEIL
ncbi:MAG TPA: ABC transporter permease [Candidatus Saccharibacteria bacterium]|nr:ABC transporter permease [Candidatus Saccharibacteria bacterium]